MSETNPVRNQAPKTEITFSQEDIYYISELTDVLRKTYSAYADHPQGALQALEHVVSASYERKGSEYSEAVDLVYLGLAMGVPQPSHDNFGAKEKLAHISLINNDQKSVLAQMAEQSYSYRFTHGAPEEKISGVMQTAVSEELAAFDNGANGVENVAAYKLALMSFGVGAAIAQPQNGYQVERLIATMNDFVPTGQ